MRQQENFENQENFGNQKNFGNMDATIDRLLAGLRATEPSPQMEQRILAALEAQSAGAQRRHTRTTVPWAVAGAVAACLVIAALALRMNPRPIVEPPRTAARVAEIPSRVEEREQAASSKTVEAPRTVTARARNSTTTPVVTRKEIVNETQAKVEDQPAPPLPLTDQERLLMRVAHRAEPHEAEVAGLSAEAREKLAARERDAFEAFFTPPLVEAEKTAN